MLKPWREVGAGDFEGVLGFIPQDALLDRFRVYLKHSGPPGVDHAE